MLYMSSFEIRNKALELSLHLPESTFFRSGPTLPSSSPDGPGSQQEQRPPRIIPSITIVMRRQGPAGGRRTHTIATAPEVPLQPHFDVNPPRSFGCVEPCTLPNFPSARGMAKPCWCLGFLVGLNSRSVSCSGSRNMVAHIFVMFDIVRLARSGARAAEFPGALAADV